MINNDYCQCACVRTCVYARVCAGLLADERVERCGVHVCICMYVRKRSAPNMVNQDINETGQDSK